MWLFHVGYLLWAPVSKLRHLHLMHPEKNINIKIKIYTCQVIYWHSKWLNDGNLSNNKLWREVWAELRDVAFGTECWTQSGDLLPPDSLMVLHPCSHCRCNCIPQLLQCPNLWGRPPSPTADTQCCSRKHTDSDGNMQQLGCTAARSVYRTGARGWIQTLCVSWHWVLQDPGTGSSGRNILSKLSRTRQGRPVQGRHRNNFQLSWSLVKPMSKLLISHSMSDMYLK